MIPKFFLIYELKPGEKIPTYKIWPNPDYTCEKKLVERVQDKLL